MCTSDLCRQKIDLTRPDISAANALTIFFADVRFLLNKTLTYINLTPHNGDCRFSSKTLCTMEAFNSNLYFIYSRSNIARLCIQNIFKQTKIKSFSIYQQLVFMIISFPAHNWALRFYVRTNYTNLTIPYYMVVI